MKKILFQMLRLIMLLPVIPIIGVGGAAGSASAGNGPQDDDPNGGGATGGSDPNAGNGGEPQDDDPVDDLPKTQEELDALIEQRVKRERKKFERQQKKDTQKPKDGEVDDPATDDFEKLAMKQENLMLKAQIAATKTNIQPAFVEDAVYLAMREVEKNGDELDDENIADALKDVLKRHPEWKVDKQDGEGGFHRVGAGGGDKGSGTKKTIPSGTVIL